MSTLCESEKWNIVNKTLIKETMFRCFFARQCRQWPTAVTTSPAASAKRLTFNLLKKIGCDADYVQSRRRVYFSPLSLNFDDNICTRSVAVLRPTIIRRHGVAWTAPSPSRIVSDASAIDHDAQIWADSEASRCSRPLTQCASDRDSRAEAPSPPTRAR